MSDNKKEEKPSVVKIVMITAGLIGVLGGAVTFFMDYGAEKQEEIQYREAQKEVSFDDSEQKHDVVDLLEIDFHPLKLSKTQDSLMIQQKNIDSLFRKTLMQKQEDAQAKKTQDSIDNLAEGYKQKNREERTNLVKDILDEIILIKVDQRKINKRLDTL